MSTKLEKFIAKARERHGDRFDYSKFVYVSAKADSTIICHKHGEFHQNADRHTRPETNHACPGCWAEARSEQRKGKPTPCKREAIPADEFVRRARAQYGDKYQYDMSRYRGVNLGSIVVQCPLHGAFEVSPPRNHIQSNNKTGCYECGMTTKNASKTKSYQEFVSEATTIHKARYRYPATQPFTTRRSFVTIVCPQHGEYRMRAQKHLCGQRCLACGYEDLVEAGRLPGGYTSELMATNADLAASPAYLYYMKVGLLYKIGVTINPTRRYTSLRARAAKFSRGTVEWVGLWSGSLGAVFAAEQELLKTFSRFRSFTKFSTELFRTDILGDPAAQRVLRNLTHLPINM